MSEPTPPSQPKLSHPNGNGIHIKSTAPESLSPDIMNRPEPPVFTDKLKEREYIKFRLAQALRMFGKLVPVWKMVFGVVLTNLNTS